MLLCSHTTLKVFHSVKNIFLFRFSVVPLQCDLETKSPGRITEGAGNKQHGRAVMIAQASSTQALSAHVPLVRRMEVASMKATESKWVAVRRWQGECFNVDTLQDVLDVCFIITQ